MQNKICIISNESVYFKENKFYCDNLDLKSIPEGLSKKNTIKLYARNSNKIRSKIISISEIEISKNILSHLLKIFKSVVKDDSKYFIISLSPYTFLSIIILKLFRKKTFLYLRSDGFKEYEIIFGIIGKLIYGTMFTISSWLSNLVVCRDHLLRGKKGVLVNPSQLNEKWFENLKEPKLDKLQLLYVGRMRKEKGIFSLIELLKNTNIRLNIVTSEKEVKNVYTGNIKIISFENYNDSIIKFYDDSNIFILPSFTEAHPQVLDESLVRKRPVLVFNEIDHVKRDRYGVFVSERSTDSLKKNLEYIINNYKKIQIDMEKNILPTKKQFLNKLNEILN